MKASMPCNAMAALSHPRGSAVQTASELNVVARLESTLNVAQPQQPTTTTTLCVWGAKAQPIICLKQPAASAATTKHMVKSLFLSLLLLLLLLLYQKDFILRLFVYRE